MNSRNIYAKDSGTERHAMLGFVSSKTMTPDFTIIFIGLVEVIQV